ncbi:MAG TPA: prolipoprotein diacylglyceryl transferase [Kineosporiaceae bacterium]
MIPSPTQSVWYLGPLPVRAYALCILMGILVAVQFGERRWVERGGSPGAVLDIAVWAVPFGIVGGRLYHVATSWQPYFGAGGHPVRALYIWEGGLGIWGAITLGALGAWIGARRAGVLLPPMADALAPGIVLAQAIGRWGNWFNNELYGGRTTLPWGLRIHEWDQGAGRAVAGPDGKPIVLGTFHPTFLYESIWDCGVAGALVLADRRWKLGHGRLFGLYVVLYTLGRGWIEALRVDPANTIMGLRLNLWTSMIVGVGALVLVLVSTRLRPGREAVVMRGGRPAAPATGRDVEAKGGEAEEGQAGQAPTTGNALEDLEGPAAGEERPGGGGSDVEGSTPGRTDSHAPAFGTLLSGTSSVEKPVVEKPVAEKPVAEKPVADDRAKPAPDGPVSRRPEGPGGPVPADSVPEALAAENRPADGPTPGEPLKPGNEAADEQEPASSRAGDG